MKAETIDQPGDTIGVDQLISTQAGLVPQAKGSHTRARIGAATVFVDMYLVLCMLA